MRRRRTALLAATTCSLAMLGMLLAGCTPTPPPPRAGLPEGVAVQVLQGRTDYTSGTLVIRIINDSDAALNLSGARLEAAGFAGAAEWDRGTTVRAGTTVDLRAPVPEPDCAAASAAPTVTLTLGSGDASNTVQVRATDPLGTLERLHDSGCIVSRVDRITRVSLGPLTVEGAGQASVAVLPLSLAPTGADGRVTVASIASTPLIQPAAESTGETEAWPISATVDAASASLSVPLRIVPARCDPHAIAEDKIGTVLVLAVTLDDGTAGDYRLIPPEPLRKALLDFVREHCGMA